MVKASKSFHTIDTAKAKKIAKRHPLRVIRCQHLEMASSNERKTLKIR